MANTTPRPWLVKLTTHRMGRRCASCSQSFELEVMAIDYESAVEKAKAATRANPETYSFSIKLVKEKK